MDEPFSALDIHTRQRMESELLLATRGRHDPRKTSSSSTHDLEEALALADESSCCRPAGEPRRSRTCRRRWRGRAICSSCARTPRSSICTGAVWADLREEVIRSHGVSACVIAARAVRATVRAGDRRSAHSRRVGMGRPREACSIRSSEPAGAIAVRVVSWIDERTIWGHLAVTLEEALLGLHRRRGARHRLRLRARATAPFAPHLRSVYQDAECGAARRAGAAVPALVRPRHLVEGGARGHARVLRDVLQHVSGRSRRRSRDHRQRAHARRVGAPAGRGTCWCRAR